MNEDAAAVSPYPYYPPHISVSHYFWTNIRSCMKLLRELDAPQPQAWVTFTSLMTYDKVMELSDLIPVWQLSSFLRNFLRYIQQKHVTRAGVYSGLSLRAFTMILFWCGALTYLNCLH